jgi:hypothetical protein
MQLLFDDNLRENIVSIINNANERLVLVSPFVILNDSVEYYNGLEKQSKKGINIELHTHTKLSKKHLEKFTNINVYYQENLHAKLYFNENVAIITSLNLIDYSIKNNIKIGFKTENETEYNEIVNEFYYPKLILNDNKNVFQYRINWILNVINKKGKYFDLQFDELKDELYVIHEKYMIKLSGKEKYNYLVTFKEQNEYIKLKYFYIELKKYIRSAYVYNNDIEMSYGIDIFDNYYKFNNIFEDIISDTFYDIIEKLFHIKSTIAHLLYKREK